MYLRTWRPNNREKMRAYDAKWRLANPDVAKESDRRKYKKYHDTNYPNRPEMRAQAVARAKRWVSANPERAKELRQAVDRRRRAKQYGSTVGPIDYKQILIEARGICGICHELLGDMKMEFDHIVPIARGGSHTQENLQAAHMSCNRRKSARMDYAPA